MLKNTGYKEWQICPWERKSSCLSFRSQTGLEALRKNRLKTDKFNQIKDLFKVRDNSQLNLKYIMLISFEAYFLCFKIKEDKLIL